MSRLFAILIWIIIISCASGVTKEKIKENPVFTTKIENPELRVIVDEFFMLSNRNNIRFDQLVSIGFSPMRRGRIIGECTISSHFREIELDSIFWSNTTWTSKIALGYHELAHCYCGREHDFDDGEKYPEDLLETIFGQILIRQPLTPLRPAGFLEDNCPKSIMYPTVLDDECMEKHYDYYVKEMFARCDPF